MVLEKHLCCNCLGNHTTAECKCSRACVMCFKKHHTYLHLDADTKSSSIDDAKTSNALITCFNNKQINLESLLATAKVRALSNNLQFTVRALIDQCAQSSFVTEELCQRLHLKKRRTHMPISGIGQGRINCDVEVMVTIRPHFESDFICNFSAYVLPKITSYKPMLICKSVSI